MRRYAESDMSGYEMRRNPHDFMISELFCNLHSKISCGTWCWSLMSLIIVFFSSDKEFPTSFESHVKKIIRLMFNVLAHVYHAHFREIVHLNLHSHLNCLFSHLVLFNDHFKLVDEKELEFLVDDVYQMNISEFDSRSHNQHNSTHQLESSQLNQKQGADLQDSPLKPWSSGF